MTARQIAAWGLLLLLLAMFITFGTLSGRWADYAIGVGLTGLLAAASIGGMRFAANVFRKGGSR